MEFSLRALPRALWGVIKRSKRDSRRIGQYKSEEITRFDFFFPIINIKHFHKLNYSFLILLSQKSPMK